MASIGMDAGAGATVAIGVNMGQLESWQLVTGLWPIAWGCWGVCACTPLRCQFQKLMRTILKNPQSAKHYEVLHIAMEKYGIQISESSRFSTKELPKECENGKMHVWIKSSNGFSQVVQKTLHNIVSKTDSKMTVNRCKLANC